MDSIAERIPLGNGEEAYLSDDNSPLDYRPSYAHSVETDDMDTVYWSFSVSIPTVTITDREGHSEILFGQAYEKRLPGGPTADGTPQ